MARRLIVEIIGDSSSYERALKKAGISSKQFETTAISSVKNVAKTFGVALGATAAVAAVKSTVDAASNLNESINAVQVTFRGASKEVLAFSKVAATEAGLSMRQLNELVTPLGASLQNYGFSAQKAAGESVKLAQRAADMASVFNTDVSQALEAIQSALRGEADPIEKFGVSLNEAAVNSQALRLGLAKSTSEITAQDKSVARLSLIYQQTDRFAGDFKNTSGGLANQQRILRARLENTQAVIGQKLLPVMLDLLDVANKLIDAYTRLRGAVVRFNNIGGGTINLPADATIADVKKVREELAKLGGEGSLAVQALDKVLQKMNSTLLHSRDLIESVRGSRFGPQGGVTAGGGRSRVDLPETTLPFRIRMLQAEGRTVASARAVSQFIAPVIASLTAIIDSGKIHSKKLAVARKRLIDATAIQTQAQETIAAAQSEAADKQKTAAKKHADAVKAAAEKQKQAAEQAARKIAAATDQARSEIGALFQGPVLAPSDLARKMALGVPGPDPGKLLADIRAQTAQALRFEADLKRLGKSGVGGSTIEELRGLGTGALPQIEAILGAPAGQRGQLIKALAARERAAQRIGQMIVHTPNVTLHARRVVVAGGRQAQSTARSGRFAGRE